MRTALPYPDFSNLFTTPDTSLPLSAINLDFVISGLENSVNISPIGCHRFL